MKIHEYQAAGLLRQYGVEASEGSVAFTADEAVSAAKKLGCAPFVLKAQVHTGGRGKAGGIQLVNTPEEAGRAAGKMLNMKLFTKQTGPTGKLVRCLFVTKGVNIKSEYYLSFTVDGGGARVVMIASAEGGTEIEQIAETAPDKIIKEPIDISIGLKAYQSRYVAERIGIKPELTESFIRTAAALYRLFIEKDCSLVEINPLVETDDSRLVAVDAKINFDQNALFRHKDILELRDISEEDPKELEASKFDLNYVALDGGEIGCMVNGAGLAMATMDIIRHFGGNPANFLDVGGGATAEKVAGAFRILLSDAGVKGILINIFGGIMKCDVIAEGIVTAAAETGIAVPIVVRLDGTNAELGKEIFRKSGLSIVPADTLNKAARTIVSLTRGQEVSA